MVCLLGGLGCLLALVLLALATVLSKVDEPPVFVYGVGVVLVIATLVLFAGSGA